MLRSRFDSVHSAFSECLVPSSKKERERERERERHNTVWFSIVCLNVLN